jgi:putative membrane protein
MAWIAGRRCASAIISCRAKVRMPSDRRLHPASILFGLAGQIRELALPGLLVLLTAGSRGWGWEIWAMALIVPYTLVSIGRYLSFRYRYEADEIVIRSGLVFRNERHVPYARIQNLDAVQNVLHRALGVVEVRLETGGGEEPEATLRVLPVEAVDEMRARVFAGRAGGRAVSRDAPADRPLLELSPRELLLFGLIENRGMVVIAAAFGLIWEIGLLDRTLDPLSGGDTSGGVLRDLWSAFTAGRRIPIDRIAFGLAALAGFLAAVRIVSMGWSLVRLHGFRLSKAGEDLRTEYGLFTRVAATIPLRRIQTLTVREGPLHRLFGRVSVRVQTAGGEGGATAQREWLAPIVRREALPRLLADVLPELAITEARWQGVHPAAFRRSLREHALVALAITLASAPFLRWWAFALQAACVPWILLAARHEVRHLAWALTQDGVLFRSGWIRRQTTAARFTRIQAIAMAESPFDRRWGMAGVHVDTAGAGATSHAIDIPYLARDTARRLYDTMARNTAGTAFRW